MKNILLLALVLSACSFSCEDMNGGKYFITFKNYSTKKVMIMEGLKDGGMNEYPDTLLPQQKPDLTLVTPNGSAKIISSNKWVGIIESLPSDTLSVYVFDSDTINTYEWSQIRADYKVLKRYDLSVQDLENSNWTITYP